MICFHKAQLDKRGRSMPVAWHREVAAAGTPKGAEHICFEPEKWAEIEQRYQGFRRSEVDRFYEGEPVSGCCDRADQS